MKTRLYVVTVEDTGTDHLVRAPHQNTALMHVMRGMATVRIADQETIVALMKRGIEVETANAEPAAEPAAQPDPGAGGSAATSYSAPVTSAPLFTGDGAEPAPQPARRGRRPS